jgi:hypothetical protein
MDNGNWLVLIITGAFFLFFAYKLGKNAGKTILFIRDLIKQVLETSRQEKP